jgi:uncharacterized membrane protein YhaH (DUF805 family)
MWSDWVIIQAVFIVLGGLLLWALVASIIAERWHDWRLSGWHRRDWRTGHGKH